MIEKQIEPYHSFSYYEHFMTDRERELFSDFLDFKPSNKPNVKMENISTERSRLDIADAERQTHEDIDSELALALELSEYQDEYMFPRLYTHWGDADIGGPNCMAFAIGRPWMDSASGKPYDIKPFPGYFCEQGNSYDLFKLLRSGDFSGAKEKLEHLLNADLGTMGKKLVAVEKDYVCKDGEHKICMMGSTELGDFHFMREGKHAWFHKPGLMSVTCFDDSGRLIVNPERSNTMYDMFYGYYVIRDKGEHNK